jgi:flagellin
MNITSPSSPTSSVNVQDLLARSLSRMPTLASVLADDSDSSLLPSDPTGLSSLAGSSSQIQSQVTTLQSTGSQLDSLANLLQQMGDLAKTAGNSSASTADRSSATAEFGQLQQQLRSLVGGSSSVIGGSDVTGSGPFGPNADGSANAANLQQGAMLSLIGQGADGSFSVDASSASATVAASANQVARARASVGEQQVNLERQAILAQIEQQNQSSAFSPLTDSSDASQANQAALTSILSQGASVLGAQGSPSAAATLQMVQF